MTKITQNIRQILSTFDPIYLDEMDNVKLMDRQDTKFVTHIKELPKILEQLPDSYYNLEVKNCRLNTYESLYYDTENLESYLKHHNERSNRYKIRYRQYVESAVSFFEVKFKSNKGRTIKERIRKDDIELSLGEDAVYLLNLVTPLDPNLLKPSLWVYFQRITLVDKCLEERATIDVNLRFMDNETGIELLLDDLVIVEVKQRRFDRSSKIVQTLHKAGIHPFKMSKYCLGIMSCHKDIKRNRFKKKLIKIAKITNNELYRLMAVA